MIVAALLLCSIVQVPGANNAVTRARAEVTVDDTAEVVLANPFRQALLKSAVSAVKAGQIKRIDLIRLRVATMSPAFLKHAEDLAIIQMAYSGDDVPVDENGTIDETAIDWDKLAAFLEKIIPLILKLIDAFASIQGVASYV